MTPPTDYDALVAELRRLRPMLELNEGGGDGSTLYAFAIWAVDTGTRAADAIEALRRQGGALQQDISSRSHNHTADIALEIVRAVLNAEVPRDDPRRGTRHIGYYFMVGLDHFDALDEMHGRLMERALEDVKAVLSSAKRVEGEGSRDEQKTSAPAAPALAEGVVETDTLSDAELAVLGVEMADLLLQEGLLKCSSNVRILAERISEAARRSTGGTP